VRCRAVLHGRHEGCAAEGDEAPRGTAGLCAEALLGRGQARLRVALGVGALLTFDGDLAAQA